MHPGHLQTYRSILKTQTPKGDLREHPSATPCPNLVGSPPTAAILQRGRSLDPLVQSVFSLQIFPEHPSRASQ